MTISRNLSFLAEGVSSTGVLGATYGGTGQSSITTGDLLYGSASNTISKLAIGSTGTILRVVAGVPSWGTDYTGTVTSVAASVPSFLSISGSPITTSGTLAITYSGTALPVANGGTGLVSLSSGYIPYGNGTSAFSSSSNLYFSGTNLGIGTSSPSQLLEVYGNQATPVVIKLTNPNAGTSAGTKLSFGNYGSTETAYLSNQFDGSTFNTKVWQEAIGYMAFGTSDTERMRLDSSGNLGLGVTPSAWGTYKAYQVGNASLWGPSTGAYVSANLYYNGANRIYISNGYATEYDQTTGTHLWYVAPSGTAGGTVSLTQAMTLDNSGYLSIGTTSAFGNAYLNILYSSTSQYGTIYKNSSTTYNGAFIDFRNSAGSSAGNIIQNGTTTVSFTTSSDYRLKENIAPMTGALAKIQALKPVTYKWKQDGSDGQGFIAHELQEVVPDCVVGEKDAVDDEGNPKYQGIDTSFLVATLVSAIQEQQAIIEQLKAKVGI